MLRFSRAQVAASNDTSVKQAFWALVLAGMGCAASAVGAQAQTTGSNVVLPGDVPIAGASTRGYVSAPPGVTTTVVPGAPVAVSSSAMTQQAAQLRQRLNALQVTDVLSLHDVTLPGLTVNTPTAYGGFKGFGAVGINYQERVRYATADDAQLGLVLSFGSPRTVGVDVGLNILDLSSQNGGGFGRRGSISLKAHRPLSRDWAVAVGVDDLLIRNRTFDIDRSFYGVVTRQIRLKPSNRQSFSRLHLSLGVGNGRFRSEDDFLLDRGNIGVFGSAALQVNRPVRLFTEWTGADLNVGASIVPFKRHPLIITPAFVDVTKRAGDGRRFTISAAYQFRY